MGHQIIGSWDLELDGFTVLSNLGSIVLSGSAHGEGELNGQTGRLKFSDFGGTVRNKDGKTVLSLTVQGEIKFTVTGGFNSPSGEDS